MAFKEPKPAQSDSGYPEPSTMIFEFDTKGFRNARLQADGKLVLEMSVSNRPMFNEDFVSGLQSELGEVVADRMIDDAVYQMHREIVIRLLVRKN